MMALLFTFVIRVMAALLCGVLIGWERQYRQRTAGLRTNALVALGSALFVLATALTNTDTRIAAQVVSGVGFLCAGVILRDGFNVRGLNTAGTLWCASATGVLAGMGQPGLAGLSAFIIVAVNLMLRPLASRINRQSQRRERRKLLLHYQVQLTCTSEHEIPIRSLLLQQIQGGPLVLQSLESEDASDPGRLTVRAELQSEGEQTQALEQLVARLSLEPSVSAIRWSIRAAHPADEESDEQMTYALAEPLTALIGQPVRSPSLDDLTDGRER
uniref:Magnesium transporter n=1 Tax=Thermogemmatispora argillosa TaxID=2045280 RepID=A0A455SYC1_9CHLR|nr:magnesium transporter [Thermogemmatispora argillosa]